MERRREGLGEAWGVRGSLPGFSWGRNTLLDRMYRQYLLSLDVPKASQRTQDVPRCTGCASAATAVTGCNRLSPLSPAVTGCHRLSPVASLQTAAARQKQDDAGVSCCNLQGAGQALPCSPHEPFHGL